MDSFIVHSITRQIHFNLPTYLISHWKKSINTHVQTCTLGMNGSLFYCSSAACYRIYAAEENQYIMFTERDTYATERYPPLKAEQKDDHMNTQKEHRHLMELMDLGNGFLYIRPT